jgi:glycosyltransferase involved in cell wall biosynthesis
VGGGRRTPLDRAAMLVSVLVPVYNEAATVAAAVDRVREVARAEGLRVEVLCVDDASTDGTGRVLARLLAEGRVDRVLRHERNRGKGAAVRAALAASTGDVVVVQDADLEYDPADWPAVLAPIVDGRADASFGSRFLGGPHRVLYYWHSVGNRALTTLSNMLTNLNLTDMETGTKAVRGDLARGVLLPRLTADRFGLEPELTARLAQAKARVYEVPVSYAGRTYAEGKKITWKDGLAALRHILAYNLVKK